MKSGRIFGTSGARGVFGSGLDPRTALGLSLSLSAHLGSRGRVLVGRDTRTTGRIIENMVVAGLSSGGCEVLRAGVLPTPALSFGIPETGSSAGIMVTASHNPPEYNGLKFWREDGSAFDEEGEIKIEEIYRGGAWAGVEWRCIGPISSADVLPRYLDHLESLSEIEKEHLVVVDCGNGAASLATPVLLRRIGCRVRSLNSNPDGFFPGRSPEPAPASLLPLAEVVKTLGAEVGVAHDGDADRVVIVDDRGRVTQADKMLALIASHMIRKKGDVVVTTVDASRVVDEAVGEKGGEVIRTGVGDVRVASEMRRRGAVFGGEPSGAWIFPGSGMAPDGPMGAIMTLELIERSGTRLSPMLDSLPDYPVLREGIPCGNGEKERAMAVVRGALKEEFRAAKSAVEIDGIRIEFEEGWILVRPSGTEPLIRITVEGRNPGAAKEIMERGSTCVRRALRSLD